MNKIMFLSIILIPLFGFAQESVDTKDSASTQFSGAEPTRASAPPKSHSIDWIIELSRGITLSRMKVTPATIATSGDYEYTFDGGIILPLRHMLYAGLSFRQKKLRYSLHQRTIKVDDNSSITTTTDETDNYLSLPVDFGFRYANGSVIPYIYGEIEPSLLTAAHQLTKEEAVHNFPNQTSMTFSRTINANVTKKREAFQLFVGAGAGVEVYYGYGTIYLEGALLFGLRKTGLSQQSYPYVTSDKLLYFPLSLGLRFYL